MLLSEIIPLFFYGMLSFSVMLIGIGSLYEIASLMIDYKVKFLHFISLIIFSLPYNIVMTFPMATLFTTLLTFSRLSNDFELVALNTGGISFIKILVPVILFSSSIAMITIIINEKVVPFANSKNKELIWEIKSSAKKNLTKEKVLIKEIENGEIKRIIYSKSIEGNKLNKVSIYEYENDSIARFTSAKKAIFNGGNWILYSGNLYKINKDGDPQLVIKFSSLKYTIKSSPEEILKKQKEVKDLNLCQTKEMIKIYKREKVDIKEIRKLEVMYNHKIAVPFASIVFSLLGAPLGIKPLRTSVSLGFGLSLIIILFYYIILMVGRIWGQAGIMSPVLAAWLPNIVVFIFAVVFIYKANYTLR